MISFKLQKNVTLGFLKLEFSYIHTLGIDLWIVLKICR